MSHCLTAMTQMGCTDFTAAGLSSVTFAPLILLAERDPPVKPEK